MDSSDAVGYGGHGFSMGVAQAPGRALEWAATQGQGPLRLSAVPWAHP